MIRMSRSLPIMLLAAPFAVPASAWAQESVFWLQTDPDDSQFGAITNPTVTVSEDATVPLYLWFNEAGTTLGYDGISLDLRLISSNGGQASTSIVIDEPVGRWTGATAGVGRSDSGGQGIDDCNAFDLTNTDSIAASPARFATLNVTGVQGGTVLVFLCVGNYRITDAGNNVLLHFGFNSGSTAAESLLVSGGTFGFCSNVQEATITVTPHQPADLDTDGDVDLTDYGEFQACYSGSLIPQPDPGCEGADLDNDGDVDPDDLNLFLGCLSGADVPADPNCTN